MEQREQPEQQAKVRLCSYKQTDDTGFAPNPFHGCCTLATCKPRIRLHKCVGDWIAGFTSCSLNGDRVGEERLIYLMQVTEKLELEEYHSDSRFQAKIPSKDSPRRVERCGDNIYGCHNGRIVQTENSNHGPENIQRDTSGVYALISSRFFYFGSEPLNIPDELRPCVPRGQSGHGMWTRDCERAQSFIDFVTTRGVGIHAPPTKWKANDTTWQRGRCSSCG